ncbi:MAG TPA: hypothetical protein VIK18_20100 [Pirellulales bacterium]
MDGWLVAAARLVAISDGDWRALKIRPGQLPASAEMARDVRLAIARVRHDPAARRVALQEHVRLLRGAFDKIDARHRREERGGEMLDLAHVGCRLAQACADLADDMRRPADQLANLKIRIAWADLLADAYVSHYETEATLSFNAGLEALAEPCLARIEWATLTRDCSLELEQWSRLQAVADQHCRKVRALYEYAARGGEKETLAFAERWRAWADAQCARAAGDSRAQLRALERAVLWSNQLVKAYDAVLESGICTTADFALAQRGLADDRLVLARFCRDRSTPQLARTELLVAATTLHSRVRALPANRAYGGSAWDRVYVGCAQALAEMRIWVVNSQWSVVGGQ